MRRPALLATLALGTAAPALATGQATVVDGHSYVSACSGSTLGTFERTGNVVGTTDLYRTCGAVTSATAGATALASITTSTTGPILNAPGAFTNTATGSASVGAIHLSADNHASTATYFAGAQVNGGWNDQITIVDLGKTGTVGIWLAPVHVDGTLTAAGNYGASSSIGVEALQDHFLMSHYGGGVAAASYAAFLAINGPLVPSNDIYYGDYQSKVWGFSYDNHDLFQTISEDLYFAVPFIYGTAFTLGIYGQVSAGESSSSIYFGDNHAQADFGNTISWGGKGYVVGASGTGSHATAFTIQSLSGFAYAGGVPEPASWALLLGGFGMSGARLRSRRQRPQKIISA